MPLLRPESIALRGAAALLAAAPVLAALLAPSAALRAPSAAAPGAAERSAPALEISVRRNGAAALAIELAIPEPSEGASAAPRRLFFPDHLPRGVVQALEIEGVERAIELLARPAEASAAPLPFAIELPGRGALRVRYQLAPAPISAGAPASAERNEAPAAALLVAPESILFAGRSPFAFVEDLPRTRLRFELGPATMAFPPLDENGSAAIDPQGEIFFAFGPWRCETQAAATLLLPAEGLRLDPQGRAFEEVAAQSLRALLAHPPAPLVHALRSAPRIALLPEPPGEPSQHILYCGGRELALGRSLWLLPAASCRGLLQLAEHATRAHPSLRSLAARDAASAAAFASAFAIDALPAGLRERALRRALPYAPLRASASDRTRGAILCLLERHGSELAEACCAAAEARDLPLDRAWREASNARGASELGAFDALASGRALFSSERLGGPWAVREEAEPRALGLHRLAEHEAQGIASASELSPAEREALRDLVARLALEITWPLARRATRWPALAPESVHIDDEGELSVSLGALYDAEAGWADELRAGEPVRRLIVGGELEHGSGRVTQRLCWRRAQLALSFELELRGVEAPSAAAREVGVDAASDAPIAFVRARREGESLELRLRGLPSFADEPANAELRQLLIAALQAAPEDAADPRAPRSTARPPRAGAHEWTPRAHARDDDEELAPAGYSGTPLAERELFGFQRWEEQRRTWVAAAFELDHHDALLHPEEAAIHARLLARFLAGLEWPLPQVEGAEPRAGGDDLPFRAGHDVGHDALDLGSRLYAGEASEPLHYPAGTAVYSPHREARRWPHPAGYPVIAVELREGDYRLRVRLDLIHVRPSREWNALDPARPLPVRATIGELQAFDARSPWGGWITTDPALRLRGESKGNHVHLASAGLFETRAADPRRNERKSAFLRAQLLPALEAAYGRAPRFPGELVRAEGSSATSARIENEAPGFHALFDGVERASALALAGYDAEQQPREHAFFAAAMRARLLAARSLQDADTGELRPLWSDGWLSREENGALVQRVETPIETSAGRYRLRLAVRYGGIDAEATPMGAVSPDTRLARRRAGDELQVELLGFDALLAAAQRVAALGAARR
ncbi:MAG: hypothetical protein JNM84_09405 [Planctomycetes bacterium]|nr:hypothetical protein [Planctomycetota bacterium]